MSRRHFTRRLDDDQVEEAMRRAMVEWLTCTDPVHEQSRYVTAALWAEEWARRHRRENVLGCVCELCFAAMPAVPEPLTD